MNECGDRNVFHCNIILSVTQGEEGSEGMYREGIDKTLRLFEALR